MAVTYKSSSIGSSTQNMTIYMPSGYVAGDLLLMQVLTYEQTMPAIPGWTVLYAQGANSDAGVPAMRVCYKISDGTENYVNIYTSNATTSLAAAYAFSGVDPILPIHATGSMAWGFGESTVLNISSSQCYPLFMGMIRYPGSISTITGDRAPVILSNSSIAASISHTLCTWFTPVMGTNTVVFTYSSTRRGFLATLALNAIPTVPPIKMNIGGVWKPATDARCNIGGVWKEIKQVEQNIGGIWKQPV